MNKATIYDTVNNRGGGTHGSYDILKVILAYIVILRHFIPGFLPTENVFSALICGGISTVAVPVYFIISGYLFFSKPFSVQRLKYQLFRILKLYLVWTVVYLPLTVLDNILDGVPLLTGTIKFIQNFIFSGSHFHLWFLPSLMCALVIVSLIHNFKKRYAIIIAVGLFAFGLLGQSYSFLVPQLAGLFEIYKKAFVTTRNGLFFGTIYVYLGYFFTQYKIQIKRYQAFWGIAVSMFLLCIEAVLMFEYRKISGMNLTVFALPASAFIFMFAQRQEVNIKEDTLLFLRQLSTALFCVHPLFTTGFAFVTKHFIPIPAIFIFVLVILGATVSSIIIVKLSEKIKFASYFV